MLGIKAWLKEFTMCIPDEDVYWPSKTRKRLPNPVQIGHRDKTDSYAFRVIDECKDTHGKRHVLWALDEELRDDGGYYYHRLLKCDVNEGHIRDTCKRRICK